jgi:hypothetical protein
VAIGASSPALKDARQPGDDARRGGDTGAPTNRALGCPARRSLASRPLLTTGCPLHAALSGTAAVSAPRCKIDGPDRILMEAPAGESWANQGLEGIELSMDADEDSDRAHDFFTVDERSPRGAGALAACVVSS